MHTSQVLMDAQTDGTKALPQAAGAATKTQPAAMLSIVAIWLLYMSWPQHRALSQ